MYVCMSVCMYLCIYLFIYLFMLSVQARDRAFETEEDLSGWKGILPWNKTKQRKRWKCVELSLKMKAELPWITLDSDGTVHWHKRDGVSDRMGLVFSGGVYIVIVCCQVHHSRQSWNSELVVVKGADGPHNALCFRPCESVGSVTAECRVRLCPAPWQAVRAVFLLNWSMLVNHETATCL